MMRMEVNTSRTRNIKYDVNSFSFGTYNLKDQIRLNLSDNTITLSAVSAGKFSYLRDSPRGITKKIIQTKSQIPQIKIVPVLPIHTPSYKTDFFLVRFIESIIIAEKSTLETTIPFPIEVGVFFVEQGRSVAIDSFSCDPTNSCFGLYGTPENGKLCKYATISLSDRQSNINPLIHAPFRIKITNELEEPASIGKIVFPITDHDLYYHNNEIDMDGLNAIVKNRVGLHVIETIQTPITKPADWIIAPRSIEKTDYKFSMEGGFD